MPANPKYLTSSGSQRFAKISASLLGGFLVTASLHLLIAVWQSDREIIFATYTFSLGLLWCMLMIFPFLFRNGWKCWLLYGTIFLIFAGLIFLGLSNHG